LLLPAVLVVVEEKVRMVLVAVEVLVVLEDIVMPLVHIVRLLVA
tara:strand:+ start:195 stop:326 length:132 start_codon:yes stop_codon:yes gene_type:complete